ncbi:MAG: hypothetical protein GY717_15490 [Rhodobacteraceae bacterium]|nr:hypothetical protein [Paracoccaceae bacterium]
MTNARGDQAKLFLRRQTVFGTAAAAGDGKFLSLPFYRFENAPKAGLEEDDAIYGDAHTGDAVDGLRDAGGSMEVPLGINSIGWHLYGLFGAPVTTGAGPYTHVFEPADTIVPVMQTAGLSLMDVNQHFLQDTLTYMGMQIAARKNGQRARATFDLLAREETAGGVILDNTPVTYSPDAVPVGFVGKVQMDGGDVASVTEFNATIASGTELDQEAMNGLATGAAFNTGRWALTGSIAARFTNRTWYDLGAGTTACTLQLAYDLGAAGSLKFLFRNVRFERSGVPITGRDVLSTSFNWRTARPEGGNAPLTVTLVNPTADYANPT